MIKLFISDVDGVLTDGGMYYSTSGEEMKKFNTRDGMGFELLSKAGVKTALITTEATIIVENRAKKLRVDHLYQSRGYLGKLEAALEICNREQVDLTEVAYIGDDLNCVELLQAVGIAACPADAMLVVKTISGIIKLDVKGGDGAVRAFVDWLFQNGKIYKPLDSKSIYNANQ